MLWLCPGLGSLQHPEGTTGHGQTCPLVTEELNSKVGARGGPHGAVTLISEVRGTIEEQSWWSDT